MNSDNRSMLIELSKKKLIPEAIKALENEVNRLKSEMPKKDAKEILDAIDDKHVTLIEKINQLKSFFE